MRNFSQKTVIGVLRDAVDLWRHRHDWNRQVAAATLVERYFAAQQDRVWPVGFHRTRDTAADFKANSERIWRWLDDVTKDTTLLPANLVPAVLLALDEDIRVQAVSELLAPLGMAARVVATHEGMDHAALLVSTAKEGGEALTALARLACAQARDVDALRDAQVQLIESMAAQRQALDFVESRLRVMVAG